MRDKEKIDELNTRFIETDEFLDWEEFSRRTNEALKADPNAATVTVPAAFLRRVMGEISVSPLTFRVYRDRHNQLCDELGLPEEKVRSSEDIEPGEITGEDMKTRRRIDAMKPLSFKHGGAANDEDEDTGGPF